MAAPLDGLPPGFEIDADPQASDTGLPPGFEIDTTPAPSAPPVPRAPTAAASEDPGLTDYGAEFGKASVRGLAGTTAAMGRGASILTSDNADEIAKVEADFARLKSMSWEEAEAFRQSLPQRLSPAVALNYQLAIRNKWNGKDAEAQGYLDKARKYTDTTPIEEQGLVKAAKGLEDTTNKAFPQDPRFKGSLTSDIGQALGSTAAFLPIGLLTGGTGVALSGAAAGADQTYQEAKKDIATSTRDDRAGLYNAGLGTAAETKALQAGRLGALPGASEVVPIESFLEQMPKFIPGLRTIANTPAWGRFAKAFGRMGTQVLTEGGQEAFQQWASNVINKITVDPSQDVSEDVLYNALIGGVVGGGMQAGVETYNAVTGKTDEERAPLPPPPSGVPGNAPGARGASPIAPQPGQRIEPSLFPGAAPPPGFEIDPGPEDNSSISAAPSDGYLLGAGWTPEQISDMNEDERRAAIEEAIAQGVEPVDLTAGAPAPGTAPRAPRGTRGAAAPIQSDADLEAVRPIVNAQPSEAQAQAGNYQKGHIRIHGLDVSIENPRGSVRRGKDPDTGQPWESPQLPADYGYINRTSGKDGDQVDVYIGPNPQSDRVYVVDQLDLKTGRFDEHKAVLAANSLGEAVDLYVNSFDDPTLDRIGDVTEMSVDEFKQWVRDGKNTKRPAARAGVGTVTPNTPDPMDEQLNAEFAAEFAQPNARPQRQRPPRSTSAPYTTQQFTIDNPLGFDGPVDVQLSVRDDGNGFIKTPDGEIIDVGNMVKAGFSPEQIVATAMGDHPDGTQPDLSKVRPAAAPAEPVLENQPDNYVSPEQAQNAPADDFDASLAAALGAEFGPQQAEAAPAPEPIEEASAPEPAAQIPAPKPQTLEAKLDAFLASKRPVTAEAFAKHAGIDVNEAGRALQQAAMAGRIVQDRGGKWRRPRSFNGPLDVLTFVAGEGGVKDMGGELRGMDLHRQMTPLGPIVRNKTGMSLDQLREKLLEAGFIYDPGWGTDRQQETTVADVLDLLSRAAGGEKIYARQDQPRADEIATTKRNENRPDDWIDRHPIELRWGAAVWQQITAFLEENGSYEEAWSPAEINDAARLIAMGAEPGDAFHEAARIHIDDFRDDEDFAPEITAAFEKNRPNANLVFGPMSPPAWNLEEPYGQQQGLPEAGDGVRASGEDGVDREGQAEVPGPAAQIRDAGESGAEAGSQDPAADVAAEQGPFGPIFYGYEGRWQDAALRLEEAQTGEAPGALSHPDVGPIALVWGEEGSSRSDGYGLAKILAWHPEVLDDLQGAIERMEVTSRSGNRIQLASKEDKAAVRLDWDGEQKVWLISAFKKTAPRRTEKFTGSLSDLWAGLAQPARRGEENIALAPAADNATSEPTTTETGADNKPQTVLPGAEQATADQVKAADTSVQDALDAAFEQEFGAEQKPAAKPSIPVASWVVKRKADGQVMFETFDKAKVDALNTEKYEAVPIQEHLAGLNKPKTAGQAAASAVKNTAMAVEDVVKGLETLFGGKNKLSSGFTFDEDTYRQAVPFFKAGVAHLKEAAVNMQELALALMKMLRSKGLTADAVKNMMPYLKRFMEDVRDGKESLDAPGSSQVLEPDSGDAAAGDGMGAADVPTAAVGNGSGAGSRGAAASGGRRGARGGRRLPQADAPVVGEDGNLELPAREPGAESGNAPVGEPVGSAPGGSDGLPDDRLPAETAAATVAKEADLATRITQQKAAESIPTKARDLDNIRKTLPILTKEQQEDVLKVEERYAQPDKHGILITNGTGTGKTFSGLGVVKRFAREGKGNILIVAPSQSILADWQKAAKLFGLELSILESTQDKGKGIVATTYANLGDNPTLADRAWDLVVTDESHKLSSDKDGTPTSALRALRAISLHADGMYRRGQMVFRKEWEAFERAKPTGKNPSEAQLKAAQAAYDAWRVKYDAARPGWANEPRSKVLMLSATPFAYHFSLDYAEGYLFDYPKVDRTGYNQAGGRDAFYISNFGYRMRTGKLTKPEADVNAEVMERQFHEKMKREGALFGRALEVEKDYDRKFILIDSAIGQKIDQALEFLSSADNGRFRALHDLIYKNFDYLTRMRLLEAMKAEAAIPYIRKSLALGRKVVVFHDYNEGGGSSPFLLKFGPDETLDVRNGDKVVKVNARELYNDFLARNPYVEDLDFSHVAAPIEEIVAEFPQALVYNGTIPNKKREEAKRLFNEDGSGRDIIIVQSAAGEAGISLHDTTGRQQRVLLNLGMPVRPTTALQEEGRIYRVGQKSDAIFRYMNTGTGWERWTFAAKIAERSGTAENLAMGDQARAIKLSFIDAFNNADDFQPEPGEGRGGKAADRPASTGISEFERAKTHYFANQKLKGKRDQREGIDYFPTPEPLGLKMVEWANVKPGEKILEPSAGHGAIARYFPESTARTLVEPSNELASRAALTSPGARVVMSRFEDLDIVNKYDAIVMNPPFGTGGKTAIDHIEKAAKHLRNGGRIVALIPRGGMADKRFEKFYDEVEGLYLVGNILLPSVTFERAGTSVAARVVILEKQTDKDVRPQEQKNRDYSDAQTINELFDRIEQADMGQRVEPQTKETDIPLDGNVTVDGIEFKLNGTAPNFYADLKSYIPNRFRSVARAAEAQGGKWFKAMRTFVFDTAAKRQAFLEAVAKGLTEEEAPAAAPAEGGAAPAVRFKTAEFLHTKTRAKLFAAAMQDRVSSEEYQRINAVAKKHGGYYSSYRGGGAVAGFIFPSEDARIQFMAELAGPPQAPLSSRTQGRLSSVAKPMFYSALLRAVENAKIDAAPKTQWMGTIRNTPGVKGEEIAWIGLEDWLSQQSGVITKAQIADFIRANQVDVQEVMKERKTVSSYRGSDDYRDQLWELSDQALGDAYALEFGFDVEDSRQQAIDDRDMVIDELVAEYEQSLGGRGASDSGETTVDTTKFRQYQLPGGDNYRELLLTLPEARPTAEDILRRDGVINAQNNAEIAESYQGGHWDEPNILAHVRFNERTDAQGKRVLFIEEVQSDWHQQGRKQGYRGTTDTTRWAATQISGNRWAVRGPNGEDIAAAIAAPSAQEAIAIAASRHDSFVAVPNAPFKTNWPELAMKRMIRWAAENGFDRVAWTTGQTQIKRYWGNQTISAAVDRFNKITEPQGVRELAANIFGREMATAMPLEVMDGGVLAVLQHDQVLRSVIVNTPVDVVNFLRAHQLSPEQLFSDKSVFANRLPVDGRDRVVAGLLAATRLTGAAIRAKLRGLQPGGNDVELLPALRASQLNSREIAGLLSPQSVFHLGSGPTPEKSASTGAAAETLPGQLGGVGGGKLTPTELASLLNAHVEIKHGHDGLLKQGFEVPPGEGMKGFYDKILVDTANKLGKKWGAKAARSTLPRFKDSNPFAAALDDGIRGGEAVHTLDIPPAMAAAAMEGQPLFEKAGKPTIKGGIPSSRLNPYRFIISDKQKAEVVAEMRKITERILGRHVRNVKLVDDKRAWNAMFGAENDGSYDPNTNLIYLALQGLQDPLSTFRHEAIHALRAAGVFTAQEWAVLSKMARERWIAQYDIRNRYSHYPDLFDLSEAQIEELMIEEAIADAMADHWRRPTAEDVVGRIMAKVKELLEALRSYLRGQGFQTVDQILERVEQGEVAARKRGSGQSRGFLLYAKQASASQASLASRGRLRPPRNPSPGSFEAPHDERVRRALFDSTDTILNRIRRAGKAAGIETLRKLQDREIDLLRTQMAIEEASGPIAEPRNAYLAASLYPGRVAQRDRDLVADVVEPLVEDIARRGLTLEEVDEFNKARHAIERNLEVGKLHKPGTQFHEAMTNPAVVGASGWSEDRAIQTLNGFVASGKYNDLEAIGDQVVALNNRTLASLLREGLITQEQYDALTSKYRYYVPLRGWDDVTSEEHPDGPRIGRRYDNRGREFQQAFGRTTEADSPLAYSIQQARQAIIRIEKNRVGKAFLRLAQANPNEEFWQINRKELRKVIDSQTGYVRNVFDRGAQEAENVFAVKVGGKRYNITLHHEGLLRAMKGIGGENMHGFFTVLHRITRFLAAVRTQFNPQFIFTNFFRDLQQAGIVLQEENISGIARRVVASLPKAMAGMNRMLNGDLSTPWARYAREFADAGGKIGFLERNDIEAEKRTLDRLMKDANPSLGRKAWLKFMEHTVERIDRYNDVVENTMRLAAYAQLRQAGFSQAKAASAARELTVNFNRKGEWGPHLNALFMFFNASTQGGANFALRLYRSPRLRKIAAGLIVYGFVQSLLNRLLSGDDDDEKNRWEKLSMSEKQRNHIIMLPKWAQEYLGVPHIKIPAPLSWNLPMIIGMQAEHAIFGDVSPLEAAANMVAAVGDSFNPLGSGGSFSNFITPTVADWRVDIDTNKNFFGEDIVPRQFDETTPYAERYYPNINPLAKWLTDTLSEMTGGSSERAGAIDWSPEWVEHVWDFALGGIGQLFGQASTSLNMLTGEQEFDARKVPFFRVFVGGDTKYADKDEYFQIRDAVHVTEKELEARIAEGDREAAARVREKYAREVQMIDFMKSAEKRLGKLRKDKKATKNALKMGEETRRKRLEAIDAQIEELQLKVRTRWNRLGEGAR